MIVSEPVYFRPSRAWIIKVVRNKTEFDLYYTFDGEEAGKELYRMIVEGEIE